MEEYVIVHHGIKGMKWGVRRFQNKDGSLTTAGKRRYDDSDRRHSGLGELIAKKRNIYGKLSDDKEVWDKGTVTNRVTKNAKKDAAKDGFTYVSKGDDYETYSDFGFGKQLMQRPAKQALVSPSEKERIDIFVDMAKDTRMADVMAKDLARNRLLFKSEKKAKRDVERLSRQTLSRTTRAELSDILYKSSKVRDEYFKRVAKRGYNALADDSDRLGGMADTALIVLDQKKSLGKMNVKKLE